MRHALTPAERARSVTPARVFLPSAERGYGTDALLALRADHAAARDAVHAPLDLAAPGLAPVARAHRLFLVSSQAADHATHLTRPDLGRRLGDAACRAVAERCPGGVDLQVVVGDGLSAAAVHAQVPIVLPALLAEATRRGWSTGRPFAVRHCRVGILNDVGDLLSPALAVLLIGERPGLRSADSLSAYVAFRPRAGHTDAERNLVSNIHAGGTPAALAAPRIARLLDAIMAARDSGHRVKEPLPPGGAGALPGPTRRTG